MDGIDVLIALFAALALGVVAWSKPLQKLSFWGFVLLCAVFHPADTALFSALESAAGTGGTMAEWTFMFSVNLLFAALLASAYRGITSLRDTPAHGHSHHMPSA
ncbi:hypothetical protein [Streptomyces pratensis]|uniref:hypothetical protein n=1 Tax=Streptomyces pratensis TaxID=1169025 RepID=UPI0030164598